MIQCVAIFNEIVEVVHNDYAGYDEKKGWDEPQYYLEKIEKLEKERVITPQLFTEIVQDYLLSFQDRHMYFSLNESENLKVRNRGFQTRRYKDALYIVEVYEESRFSVGAKIVTIDHQTIDQVIKVNEKWLRETSAEREDWSHIINKSSWIEIEDSNGGRILFDLKDYKRIPQKKEHSAEVIDGKTLCITLPSFVDVESTLAFVKKHTPQLKIYPNLIIDVRNNNGGNGQASSTLLPYVFPKDEKPSTKSELREFNYTARNSDLFIQLCQNFRKSIHDEETLSHLDSVEELCEKYRGQGFVTLDFSDSLEKEVENFEGTDYPEKVVILTDVYCASAAEYFVETAMESSKVTVVGRATMGVNDYSDLLIKEWENLFSLYYPISRRVEKTVNDPLHGKGIQPHHYIPWTPRHINEDVDLLFAMNCFK